MAGQAETDTVAVGGTGSPDVQQADTGATGTGVPDGSDNTPQSGPSRPAKDESKSSDAGVVEYRLKKLEAQVAKMRKVFLDHTHETLGDQPPPANTSEATATAPEPEAVKAEIAEKPPQQSREREEKRKEARREYFTRIHRQKGRTRQGVDD